mgnify:CR=1 FL=1
MWFTRVSLKNPVFATMVMLALVVLGMFSLQRLQVDQFPSIDFPVVVVITDYPGASPEIVESEVSKKVEEGVNAIAGINALTSRSYEGQSLVIIEFGLHVDGRKAAEDVREKIATVKPLLRSEVKEPRVLRFDPSSRAVWSVAVLPDTQSGTALSAVELTNWAEQNFKKRLENVRGVGSVTLVGGTKREINLYLNPQALESFGITPDLCIQAKIVAGGLPGGAVSGRRSAMWKRSRSPPKRPRSAPAVSTISISRNWPPPPPIPPPFWDHELPNDAPPDACRLHHHALGQWQRPHDRDAAGRSRGPPQMAALPRLSGGKRRFFPVSRD